MQGISYEKTPLLKRHLTELSSKMAFYHRNSERKRIPFDYRRQEEEVVGSLCRLGSRPVSPKSLLEQEKRIRREIANSNERRRMQSINAGFQTLKLLLPHREGEKLSKAAILQCTADLVYQLEQEKTRLLEQNSQMARKMLNSPHDSDGSCPGSPPSKRRRREQADSVDEGIGSSSPSRSENDAEDLKRELSKLRRELAQERELRMLLEQQVRTLESRLYHIDNGSDTADQINLQYHSGTEDPGKCSMSIINLGHESGLGSPQSQISSQDVESGNEMSLSPDLSSSEIPEDLSGKNSAILLRCEDELSFTDVSTIPGLLLSTNHLNVSSCTEEPQQPASYEANRPRHNLDTIVEAIKHVEGVDIFHADPKPVESELSLSIEEKASLLEEQYEEQIQHVSHSLTDRDFSFQHQIIRNAPLTQSRPGVIVSNLS